jgi:threonine dehydrogenase-like Zn-dependent dehydrogenase
MTRDQDISPVLGVRTIFNGINAEQMFVGEKVPLPELAVGEILVKVRQDRFRCKNFVFVCYVKVRLASICMSDVHTITGQRIEPTPR